MKLRFKNEMDVSVRFESMGGGLGSTKDRKLHLHKLSSSHFMQIQRPFSSST
ncbi:hypothetical protein PEC302107_37390 [Pectobacterium araliae]|nr:hypothetical protein PEC302107_37390 [Pectobacterium carotovorum subsp. carotovorum]